MRGAGANRLLIAAEGGDEQRAASICVSTIEALMCSAASPAPPRASSSHKLRRAGVSTGTGKGIGSAASAGTPRASLAAR